MTEAVFWTSLGIVFYTYLGYPIILGALVQLHKRIKPRKPVFYTSNELPEITILIASYNEADIIRAKIANTLNLDYPVDKRKIYFVTDGSTDSSMEIIQQYPEIKLFHEPGRKGKNAAVNRVMPFVTSPIVVFCDANTTLNKESLNLMVRHYKDNRVGAVAGEKRVAHEEAAVAAGSGESAYWKYESRLKKWDSELNTVVGAAGELFSIRTSLFENVSPNVLIEDFRLSMNIARNGYRVVYEPAAYAVESGSASMEEEKKRKIRISAGGLIEVWHFMGLLNFFRYGLLSFQYVSHRMLRWTLAPLSLCLLLLTNLLLALMELPFYQMMLVAHLGFYFLAFLGYISRNRKTKIKLFFIPYYFVFMNLSVFQGLLRLITGKQSVVWDKAKRAE